MVWDVIIIGGGPGGMQAAIAAASEALTVIVIEKDKVGGQIGQTPRLENSVFAPPGGVTGPQFAAQMKLQAQNMGVKVVRESITSIESGDREIRQVRAESGEIFLGRSVVLAMGSSWHHLTIPGLKPLVGKSVHYGPVNCLTVDCVGQDVAVFGGGPSAGQAIIELSSKAEKVHVILRSTLKMPQYLVDRIHSLPNIVLYEHSRIDRVRSTKAKYLHIELGSGYEVSAPHMFLCAGLTPATKWLKGIVDLDENGRVKVGGEDRQSLETSVPGVFAIGDCRVGSTPRVGVAIGDGSMAVTQIWNRFIKNPVCTNCAKVLA